MTAWQTTPSPRLTSWSFRRRDIQAERERNAETNRLLRAQYGKVKTGSSRLVTREQVDAKRAELGEAAEDAGYNPLTPAVDEEPPTVTRREIAQPAPALGPPGAERLPVARLPWAPGRHRTVAVGSWHKKTPRVCRCGCQQMTRGGEWRSGHNRTRWADRLPPRSPEKREAEMAAKVATLPEHAWDRPSWLEPRAELAEARSRLDALRSAGEW